MDNRVRTTSSGRRSSYPELLVTLAGFHDPAFTRTRSLVNRGDQSLVHSKPPSPSSADRPPCLVDRMSPRVVNALTVAGFAIPVLGYLVFVGYFSVNVIVNDQWDDVTVIRSSYGHFPDWSALWIPHNENRIFFPISL